MDNQPGPTRGTARRRASSVCLATRDGFLWVLGSGGVIRTFRAVVITIVLLVNGIYALPYSKMEEENVTDPDWQKGDFAIWYGWLDPILWMDQADFSAVMRRVWWAEHETVRMMRLPFKPVFDRLHVNQQWGLFAVVSEAPDRLVVEVRRNKEWEILYRRLDGQHDWHDNQLKYRRIRGVWDGVKEEPKGTYKRMARWIARMVFLEQPDVDRVRIVLEKEREALPWEEPDPTITRRAEKYHKREDLMKTPKETVGKAE